MQELTIIIDYLEHNELKEYLMSLNGILAVTVKNNNNLEINIKYDSQIIGIQRIRMEILLFLDILKIPSILAFDKHSNVTTSKYQFIINDLCCEYCFKGIIDDLLLIEGIEKVTSNFNKEIWEEKTYDEREKVMININYNSHLITLNQIKQIESKINQ